MEFCYVGFESDNQGQFFSVLWFTDTWIHKELYIITG